MSVLPPAPPLSLPAFAAATLGPAGLIAAGLTGGPWPWVALGSMLVLPPLLDLALPRLSPEPGAEFPGSDALLALLAGVALCLPLAVTLLADAPLGAGQTAALIAAAGLWLGQVAHPAAHELIHRPDRRLFWLGVAVYSALLIGHHASSHRLVHHIHVATPRDPASARRGEGFWRFALRAGIGGFRQGYRAEAARHRRPHPYLIYLALSALVLAVLAAWGGGWAVLAWLVIACHAQLQIHLSDYVQHYGLVRQARPDGRIEPAGPRHAWNGAHWYSSALYLNAPRHSDHHAHPARPFAALSLPEGAPLLPWPLPIAALVALVPPLWRSRMDPLLARLSAPTGD